MFLHNLKYELLSSYRVKDLIIWLILFPMILGTLFKAAFGNIYENISTFKTIPAAVVVEDGIDDTVFRQVMDSMTEGDEPFLKITYTDMDSALEMLRKDDIKGIITCGEKLSLTVSGTGSEQSALRSFANQYNNTQHIVMEALKNDPASAQKVIMSLQEDCSPVSSKPMTQGNTDNFIQYFYNLIAMVAIYGSVTGLHITVNNQANLSPLGARKCCSPTPKAIGLGASLIGSYIVQSGCMIICVSFLRFVLDIDFGDRLLLVYISAICGGILGVSLGFFIGSLNKFSFGMKTGLCMTISMISCYLSGLMVGDIKGDIASNTPWLNKINPASVISDCFYCLNIDSDYSRLKVKLLTMFALSAVFSVLGIIITRRKKYAYI